MINYRKRWAKAGFVCCVLLLMLIIKTRIYDTEYLKQDRVMAKAFIARMNAGLSRIAE